MKKKQNNQGFSLIELLVAITILAIIAIPLLHSFVTASKTNAKAKKMLEATTAGQNLMEEIKADSFAAFLQGADSSPAKSGETNLLDANGNQIYLYTKKQEVTIDGHTYQAVVTLDPTQYTTTQGTSSDTTDYNSVPMPQITSMSKKTNAFLIQSNTDDRKAAKQLDDENFEDIYSRMQRDILLEINWNQTTQEETVYATITYTDPTTGNMVQPILNQEIYNNSLDQEDQLSGIYLCFVPMNTSDSKLVAKETIQIQNISNYPVDLNLVRQSSTQSLTNYGVKLTVNEGARIYFQEDGTTPKVVTQVITNLSTNPAAATKGYLKAEYQSRGVTPSLPSGLTANALLNLNGSNLVNTASANHIYGITVKIYNKGDDVDDETIEPLATLKGTKTE